MLDSQETNIFSYKIFSQILVILTFVKLQFKDTVCWLYSKCIYKVALLLTSCITHHWLNKIK